MSHLVEIYLNPIESVDEEIICWVEDNIPIGKWQVSYSFSRESLKIVFTFINNEDAMAFKLRWI